MKPVSLLDSAPYFGDLSRFMEDAIRNVAGSTAIETGGNIETIAKDLRRFVDAGMPPLKKKTRPRAPKRTRRP